MLEEDIALANMALDCIGQATLILRYAGDIEGAGRTEDALAYWRDERDFKNSRLAELPKGDFAFTICRHFLFGSYAYLLYRELRGSRFETLKGIAEKSMKEFDYHLRHCREWMLRLGGGTDESRRRLQNALDDAWPYCDDLFLPDPKEEVLTAAGAVPDRRALKAEWDRMVDPVIAEALLDKPALADNPSKSVRDGTHTEFLGHLLAEMQVVARAHPGASW